MFREQFTSGTPAKQQLFRKLAADKLAWFADFAIKHQSKERDTWVSVTNLFDSLSTPSLNPGSKQLR